MLDTRVAQSVIDHAIALGADFAEVFVERNQVNNMATLSNQVRDIASGIDFGVGLRLVYGAGGRTRRRTPRRCSTATPTAPMPRS